MDHWPKIRSAIRDTAAIALGLYIGIRGAEPPITLEDFPAFVAAGTFLGVPYVERLK